MAIGKPLEMGTYKMLPIDQNVLIGHLTTARDKYLLTKTSGCYLSHVIKFNFMRLDFCFKIAMSTHVLAF